MNTASGIFVAPAPAELAARRKVIYQQVITALDGVLEWEPGHPLVDRFVDSAPASPDKRCRYSMAFAYLAGDERQRQKGAALLEATELPTFDNHAVAILATLLKVHGSQLPAQTRALLLERLARYAAEAGTEDFRVQGFNDNAPMHCLTTLLFAGDLLGNRALAKLGLERLRDAVAMLERRGVLGEMNSPTYTA